MFSLLRQRIRRRLLGRRLSQRLLDDHTTIGKLGNLYYRGQYPGISPEGYVPVIRDFEFSCHSQNGEDGIILYLLSRINVENHFIVEIGTEDGHECNSTNLILNFGWHACLIESDVEMASNAVRYFRDANAGERVQVINERATPENINRLISKTAMPRQPDVLSIDIDSHDYWLWEAMDVIEPRLVVIEYNASFGPSRSVTIPYGERPQLTKEQLKYYQGASITALSRLGKRKGYELIAGDSKGVNAFFIRNDICTTAGLSPATPEQVYRLHFRRSQKRTPEEQLQIISEFELTEVN